MGFLDGLLEVVVGVVETGVGVVSDVAHGDLTLEDTRKGLSKTVSGTAETVKSIVNLEP